MKKVIIIRYAELFLKGKNRGFFEKTFENNMKRAIKDIDCELIKNSGRYLIDNFDTCATIYPFAYAHLARDIARWHEGCKGVNHCIVTDGASQIEYHKVAYYNIGCEYVTGANDASFPNVDQMGIAYYYRGVNEGGKVNVGVGDIVNNLLLYHGRSYCNDNREVVVPLIESIDTAQDGKTIDTLATSA